MQLYLDFYYVKIRNDFVASSELKEYFSLKFTNRHIRWTWTLTQMLLKRAELYRLSHLCASNICMY